MASKPSIEIQYDLVYTKTKLFFYKILKINGKVTKVQTDRDLIEELDFEMKFEILPLSQKLDILREVKKVEQEIKEKIESVFLD